MDAISKSGAITMDCAGWLRDVIFVQRFTRTGRAIRELHKG